MEARQEKEPDFTWEVRANDSSSQNSGKKFLFFQRQKYAGNTITTSKYNVATFIPLNMFHQLHQAFIIYFVIMVILQCIPMITTAPWYASVIPLSILMSLRAIKDLIEDIARHKSDRQINNRPAEILRGSSFCHMKWKHIQVGDIVRLKKDDLVPADLLLLRSSEPNSLCYVETSGIDGETNLKFRQAPLLTHTRLSSTPALANFNGKVSCEAPNSKMLKFVGTLEWNGEKCPLDNNKMLLRGCSIRNTRFCYGLVIYAGIQTKIMKNSGKVTRKKTKLDLLMNKIVFSIFVLVIIVAFCCAVGAGFWQKTIQEKHHYIPKMPPQIPPAFMAFFLFWGYLIILNILVPLMLYLTMEVIYMVHSSFINWDLEMYHAETDTPASARATSLNDHLGQIEYIFSDKTGTLTQNIMTFKKCCINGRIYGTSSNEGNLFQEVSFHWNPYADKKFHFHDQSLVDTIQSNKEQEVQEFFRLLALCHTVMVEEKEGELVYQASSPDEEALVTAARSFGYVFLARTQDTITVSELGVERTYSVLAHMDFNSDRKRMSILVRDPDGKIMLYTKGADNVILQRLNPVSTINDATEKALDTFSNETLRTLCIAFKQVEESEYIPWGEKHKEASLTLQNRAKELQAVYEEIETNLELLGITAIEDKLQDGVSETIELLRKGNMKIWVLTGDKQETAVNIGFSCSLLTKDMKILDEKAVCDILEASLNKPCSGDNGALENNLPGKEQGHHGRLAAVVTGDFLSQILNTDDKRTKNLSLPERLAARFCPEMLKRMDKEKHLKERAFVDLASHCQTVICCRVTPKQKAIVVEMVKKHKKVTTLAIGDGGNDVNMIKTAHIGVGISGQEGLQAVIASDYALAQFRFLQRLLLVHGRWSYFRICKYLRYYFYKTFAVLLGSLWFACFSGFSGQIAFDIWYLIFNGVIYTVFPVLVMGMIDQDVGPKTSLQFPELYCVGQKDSLFNYKIFLLYILYGIFSSMATFFIPLWAFWDTAGPEGICDYQAFSMTVGTGAILAVTAEVCLEYSQWNVFSVLTVLFSLGIFFLTSFLTQLQASDEVIFPFKNVSRNAFSKLFIWAIILLSITVSVLPSLVARCLVRITHPSIAHRSKELSTGIAEDDGTVELESYSKENWLRRASNAFSHDEGYADLISRGASIRRSRGASVLKKRAVHPCPPPQEERGPCQEENTTHNSRGSI